MFPSLMLISKSAVCRTILRIEQIDFIQDKFRSDHQKMATIKNYVVEMLQSIVEDSYISVSEVIRESDVTLLVEY